MKKIISFGSIICLLSSFATISCTKESTAPENPSVTYTINVSADEMKSSLDGKSVIWKASDRIACLSYDADFSINSLTKGIAPKTIDGKNAEFEITSTSGMPPRIIVHPSIDGYSLNKEKNGIWANIPSEYEVEAGMVPDTALYSVGKIVDGNATMRNLLSFFKLEIESSDITKVKLSSASGEPLSGSILFEVNSLTALEGENKYTSIVPKSGTECFTPGVYYIPVPSGTLETGLILKFFKKDNSSAKKTSEKAYTIPRNKFINLGKESDLSLVFEPSIRIIHVVFSDGTSALFPFSKDSVAVTAISIPAKTDVVGTKYGPLYHVGDPGLPFYFYVAPGAASPYFTVHKSYGLRMGGTIGDYVLLPPIPNMTLIKIDLYNTYTQTRKYRITDDNALLFSASSVSIAGKTWKTFELKGTGVNTAYRIANAAASDSHIGEFKLYYEKAED